jgi:hypothetical protein
MMALARRAWWLPVLVVVMLIVFMDGPRRDDDGQLRGSGQLEVSELRVGDCFDADHATNIATVEAKPCDEPHAFELYHVGEWTGGHDGYPSDVELGAFVFDACLSALGDYTGEEVEGSRFFFSPIIPDEAAWDGGRRVVYCALFDLTGKQLVGSQRAP